MKMTPFGPVKPGKPGALSRMKSGKTGGAMPMAVSPPPVTPRQRGGVFGGLGGPRTGEFLRVLSAGLADMDGTMGSGNLQAALAREQAARQGQRADQYNRKQDARADVRYQDQLQYGRKQDAQSMAMHADALRYGRKQDARSTALTREQMAQQQANADRAFGLDEQALALRAQAGSQPAGYRFMTPDEVASVGLPPGTVAQIGADGRAVVIERGADPNAPGKSMLGAETAARAAAGLPGAIEATSRLEDLMLPEPGTLNEKGRERKGYRPGQDWGAQVLDWLPIPGSDSFADYAGGSDYREFNQAFSQFEAAIMPIMSGAAVSESEAARLINSVKPQNNDTPETLRAKFDQMNRINDGLEAALRGDNAALLAMIDEARGSRSSLSNFNREQEIAPRPEYGIPEEALNLGINAAQWDMLSPEEKAMFE